jgi:putative membrane protein (TIGR04086 family)
MKWKAILAGVGAYVGMWVIWNIAAPSDTSTLHVRETIFQVFTLVAAIVPGYVAGRLAKQRQVSHGLAAGGVLAIITLAIWFLFGMASTSNWVGVLYYPAILCAFGTLGGKLSEYGGNKR